MQRIKVLGAVTALSMAATTALAADSTDPIKLALHEWTGQHISTYIAGEVLKKMGYEVEYVTAGVYAGATALADGNITAALEIWDNNLGEFYPNLLESGAVGDLGSIGLDAREGWLYPKHVEELCPGLPAWDAFVGCAEVFATAETFPNGRFVE